MKEPITVTNATRIQLQRLFGSSAKVAQASQLTPNEYKKVLENVLDELERYLRENVQTDKVHYYMLLSGLYAAREALTEDDFYAGYIEGITRLALILMGDYPDHRKRKGGAKSSDYYNLRYHRSLVWLQSPDQKLKTLRTAWQVGKPKLSKDPMLALHEFREIYGDKPDYCAFLDWYKKNYPADYAAVF